MAIVIGNASGNRLRGTSTADTILGEGGDDRLEGRSGNDLLIGGDGHDRLDGDTGVDSLTGNAGRDKFYFDEPNASGVGAGNRDAIADFEGAGATAGDVIDVSEIDANVAVLGDQAFVFIGTAAFTAAGQIRAEQVGADTVLQANTAGVSGAEFEIELTGIDAADLTPSDFLFV